MSGEPPPLLFILGPQRAGTSVMLNLAREVLGYSGAPEGWIWGSVKALEDHFAAVRQELSDVDPREIAAFSIATFSTDALLKAHVDALIGLHVRKWGEAPIVDKTPGREAIKAAPAVRRRLPAARFMVMKRRGIENVQSQLRRFPNRPFETACSQWADAMQAWLAVRDEFAGAALEIDQADLHRNPEGVAERLAGFLGAADTGPLAEFFHRRFPEKTKAGDYGPDIDLHRAGWDDSRILQFMEICGPMMDAFGYATSGEGAAPLDGVDLATGEALKHWVIAAQNRWTSIEGTGLRMHPDHPGQPPVTLRLPAALTPGRYQFCGEVIVFDARCQPLSLTMSIPGAAAPNSWTLPIDGSRAGRCMWEIPPVEVLHDSDLVLQVAIDLGSPNHHHSGIRLNSATFVRL